MAKAMRMIDDAACAGAECVKFQCHIPAEEMSAAARKVVPGNASESIWEIISRCTLDEAQERDLKQYAESRGLLYLSTPFSRAAADRLEAMGVLAYKIGSGECNNYPLVDHIASFGKPILLSTGMNDLESIGKAVAICERRGVPYALLHCTSLYPTPYSKVRLGALALMRQRFPKAVLGLSDHSLGPYTGFAAVALGASIVEKHFTSDPNWPGPDIAISLTPEELRQLVVGARAIFEASGGTKEILPEEQPTIDFAYACVVTLREVKAGEALDASRIWVKRPGNGEIRAERFPEVLGRRARVDLPADTQLCWEHLDA